MHKLWIEARGPLHPFGLLKTPGGHIGRPPTKSPRCSLGCVPTTPPTRPSIRAAPTRHRVLESMSVPQRTLNVCLCWDSTRTAQAD